MVCFEGTEICSVGARVTSPNDGGQRRIETIWKESGMF